MRRATVCWNGRLIRCAISIHALHEESDATAVTCALAACISIHALHEESDVAVERQAVAARISIHALHEESDMFGVSD